MMATWLPDVLRSAGLSVVEHAGWRTRSHGPFRTTRPAVVWHHDASGVGPSPGVPGWVVSNWRNAGYNAWVNRAGVWTVLAAGVAWHAGAVLAGRPGNFTALGVSWDNTINETPAPAMYDSTRRGIAAILRHVGNTSAQLEFHKSVASPVGRKIDPWFDAASNARGNWAGELTRERAAVAAIMAGGGAGPAPQPDPDPDPVPEETEMALSLAQDVDSHWTYAIGPGYFEAIPNPDADGVDQISTGADLGLWPAPGDALRLNWVQIRNMRDRLVPRDGANNVHRGGIMLPDGTFA